MAEAITLWGAGTSRTMRPVWVCEELGIPYKLNAIGPRTGETQTPDFTRMNPKQKIPLLVDGALKLTESVAICRYLIRKFPGAAITTTTTPERHAIEDAWCCYIYGEIDETSLYVMRRHRDLAAIYGEAPAAVDSSRDYALRHLAVVSDHLIVRETLLDEGFTLADILLGTCLDWAHAYGLPLTDTLAGYRKRLNARDAYQRAKTANFKGN